MVNVNFIALGSPNLASHRFRVLKPCALLNKFVDGVEATYYPTVKSDDDVNVFSKHFDAKRMIKEISDCTWSVFDICDDHFDRTHGEFYKIMCDYANVITCSSKKLVERIKEVTGHDAVHIPDPVSFPYDLPRMNASPQHPLNLIWYGHSSNAPALDKWIEHIPQEFTAVCDMELEHEKINYVKWEPNKVEFLIRNQDVVLLPTTGHDWAKYKSPNRVVDALAAGKLVITDDEDLYGEFKDFITIIKDPSEIPEILGSYRENFDSISSKIQAGQKYVRETYNNQVILDGWIEVLEKVGKVKRID